MPKTECSTEPRRVVIERKQGEIEMPPCRAAYMVGYLFEVGPVVSVGQGQAVISHTEIAAWQSNTGIRLNAWESRTLKTLSSEYLSESYQATDQLRPAPWQGAAYAKPEETIRAERVKDSLRKLAAL